MTEKDKAAATLLTAVKALAWFVENSDAEDPNRASRFFAAREISGEAIQVAEAAGISVDEDEPWKLITAGDAPQMISLKVTPEQARRLIEKLGSTVLDQELCVIIAETLSAA